MDYKHLKMNDVVYIQTRDMLYKTKVTRITPKQLVVELSNHKYRREDGAEVGGTSWHWHSLILPNKEIEKQYIKQQAIIRVKNRIFNLHEIKSKLTSIDIEKLKEAHDLLHTALTILTDP